MKNRKGRKARKSNKRAWRTMRPARRRLINQQNNFKMARRRRYRKQNVWPWIIGGLLLVFVFFKKSIQDLLGKVAK